MHRAARPIRPHLRAIIGMFALLLAAGGAAYGQDRPGDELIDRPVSGLRVEGLVRVTERMVLNNIRTAVGDPYQPDTVRGDVRRLTRLGEFKFVDAVVEAQANGSVVIRFLVTEQAIIADVQVVGNRLLTDDEVRAVIPILPGGPRDDFLIDNGKRSIETLYRSRGHYLTTVLVDTAELDESGVLIYIVREGPRVRVKAVGFRGAKAFVTKRLLKEIKTKPEMFMFRKGELNEEIIRDDVGALDRFYKSRGYLDVRVDRAIELSPDHNEAKVVFLIDEGRQYTLGAVQARRQGDGGPLRVFAPEQLAAMLEIKTGDVYSTDLVGKSLTAVMESYGIMGYLDVQVLPREIRSSALPVVDLLLEINEGRPYKVGLVQINGNFLTRDKVIRRHVKVEPGRPYNSRDLNRSERRLISTRLFNESRFTVQQPDEVDSEYRDLLVEIKERNTGSLNFGFAVGSDSGLFGEFSYQQRNFDVTDPPTTFTEMLKGRAFRGGGQRFSMTLRPGSEIFQYILSLTDPNVFDSDYSLSVNGAFRNRFFEDYDESRLSASVQLGRQFGDIWSGSVRLRYDEVELDNIDPSAPVAVFNDAGPDTITGVGLTVTRSTIETFDRPGRGSRLELSYSFIGGISDDIEFQRVNAEYTLLLTMSEDFLGRKSILRLSSKVGHIFDGSAPVYERFYLGGRSLRGFDFRTVSPKGIRADTMMLGDDPIGGAWMMFLGAQYEVPLVDSTMTWVVFVDSGTVTEDPGFDDFRVSLGMGLRMYIPAFGQLPIAFDFAIPLQKQEGDETQVFSFTAELPF